MNFTKTTIRVLIRFKGTYSIRDLWSLGSDFFISHGKEEGRTFVKLHKNGNGSSTDDLTYLEFYDSETETMSKSAWKVLKK